jgi:hypothetical protein
VTPTVTQAPTSGPIPPTSAATPDPYQGPATPVPTSPYP